SLRFSLVFRLVARLVVCLVVCLLGGLLLRRSLLRRLFLRSFSRFFVVFGQQFLAAHLVVGDIDLRQEVVNDLLLVERSADACECLRVLTVELEDFLLLVAREAADRFEQGTLHLFLRDLHACFLTDLGQDQTKTNATFSKTLVLFARSFLSGVLVLKRAASLLEFARHLCPDVLELSFDQLGRRFKLVRLIQSVEELTLCLLARDRTELILELAANDLTQL